MGDINEQTIVISDLLSFLSCKIKLSSKEKLLKTLSQYYLEKDIAEAHRTLLASLPEKKSTRHGRRVKHPNTLIAMYDCFQLIPEQDLPIFVCKDLNNVPELDVIKEEPEEIILHEEDLEEEETEEIETGVEQTLREEQRTMKSQIADIAFVVKQLKDQLQNISEKSTLKPSEERGAKLKKRKDKNQSKIKESSNLKRTLHKKPRMEPNVKKKGLAYLQSLIDEDEERSDKDQSEKDNESDYQEEIDFLDTEFEDFGRDPQPQESISCEVILKEEPEDTDSYMFKNKKNRDIYLVSPTSSGHRGKYFRDDCSPSKTAAEKVLYIKNEEERGGHFDEDENSIEIASASDFFGNFDDSDPSSRIFLEVCRDGSFNIMETPKVSVLPDFKEGASQCLNGDDAKLWCCLCGSQFDREDELVEHISHHENGSPLNCCKCSFDTLIPEEMNKHLRTEHGDVYERDRRKMYRCVICKFKSKSKRRMEIHVDCHYEKKSDSMYECQICSKMYLNHASLRKHKKIHAGVRPHVCGICGLSFVFQSYLTTHIKTHETQKPFRCSFCPSQFISKDRVRRHERTHTGEKPYKCLLCNHRSARSDGIDNHFSNVHSDYKPYQCNICHGKFVSQAKLKRHLSTHSQNKSFFCKECEKTFKSIDTLKYHCKYYGHHQEIKEIALNI